MAERTTLRPSGSWTSWATGPSAADAGFLASVSAHVPGTATQSMPMPNSTRRMAGMSHRFLTRLAGVGTGAPAVLVTFASITWTRLVVAEHHRHEIHRPQPNER